jgi:putative SOS response-associated peptidase YedK
LRSPIPAESLIATMATEGDLLITKATVILEKPADWQRWLFLRKDSAERNDLWQYIDPSLKAEQVKRVEQEKPKVSRFGVSLSSTCGGASPWVR